MSAEQAPSIGPISMDFDPSGQRVRQIIEAPIEYPAELATALDQAHLYAEANGATRTAVRALVPDDQIDMPNGFSTEAVVPLSDNFTGLYLSYFGHNAPERRSSVIPEEMSLLAVVRGSHVKAPVEILQTAETKGFRLERLQGDVPPDDHERLIAMYRASFTSYPFPIEDQIAAMIGNPNTQVYAARSAEDGQLYAVAATEQVVLNTGSGPFIMREMGDSAKLLTVNGLNAPIKLMLIAQAARDGVDMIFCESRAALGAVNAVNHGIGMQWCGLLPKHTLISGPASIDEVALDGVNGQYGNMHVWALNSEQLQDIGSQVQEYYASR